MKNCGSPVGHHCICWWNLDLCCWCNLDTPDGASVPPCIRPGDVTVPPGDAHYICGLHAAPRLLLCAGAGVILAYLVFRVTGG